MSIVHITKNTVGEKLKDGYFGNVDCSTINGSVVPSLSDVIIDSTDSVLTSDAVMVGDGALKIKQTSVTIDQFGDINNALIVNANTLDTDFVYSGDIIADFVSTGELRVTQGANTIKLYSSGHTYYSLITAPVTGFRNFILPDVSGTAVVTGTSPVFTSLELKNGANTLKFNNSANTFTSTFTPASFGSNRTITIPDTTGTMAITGASQAVQFGAVTLAGNINSTGAISTTGSLSCGNISSSGSITNVGNITMTGSITMPGNLNMTGGASISMASGNITTTGNLTCGLVNTRYPCGFQSSNGKGMICFDANSAGTILVSTGGASISKGAAGVYTVTLTATSCYGATASISEVGTNGFITVERITSASYLVVIRNNVSVGTDMAFNFSCAFQ